MPVLAHLLYRRGICSFIPTATARHRRRSLQRAALRQPYVDLTLQQGGSIEVTVVHADGRAGASCLVRGRIEGDSVDPKTEFSGASGVVKLTGLKPGKWRLNVSPIGPGTIGGPDKSNVPEQVVEVKAGEAAKARFEIP